jgi:hypothetical protein
MGWCTRIPTRTSCIPYRSIRSRRTCTDPEDRHSGRMHQRCTSDIGTWKLQKHALQMNQQKKRRRKRQEQLQRRCSTCNWIRTRTCLVGTCTRVRTLHMPSHSNRSLCRCNPRHTCTFRWHPSCSHGTCALDERSWGSMSNYHRRHSRGRRRTADRTCRHKRSKTTYRELK